MSDPGPQKEPSGRGADIVWSIIGTLIAGVLAWGGIGWLVGRWLGAPSRGGVGCGGARGGIGWLLDRWLGTRYLVAVGIVVGMAGAFYLIIKRYGSGWRGGQDGTDPFPPPRP